MKKNKNNQSSKKMPSINDLDKNSHEYKELLNKEINDKKFKFFRDNNLHKLNSTELRNQIEQMRSLAGVQS